MEMRGVLGSFYVACEWIVRLALVNILWVGFSLLGGVVLGIFPATIAMFTITRKWIQGETDLPIFQRFWAVYRKEFIKSNVFGFILVIIGAVLVTDIYIFYSLEGVFSQVLFYLFIAITFNYAIMLLYIFPIYVHYDLKLFQNFRYALIIGMSNPFHTFSMILCLVFVYFALEVAPASFLFLSVAPLSMMYMVIAHRIFLKIEQKKSEEKSG
ncbi:YesL family protein [Anaerobacillus alkaliphilus]|nr:YesL family protein [Anaerobacillus alkaliphilus]